MHNDDDDDFSRVEHISGAEIFSVHFFPTPYCCCYRLLVKYALPHTLMNRFNSKNWRRKKMLFRDWDCVCLSSWKFSNNDWQNSKQRWMTKVLFLLYFFFHIYFASTSFVITFHSTWQHFALGSILAKTTFHLLMIR